MWGNNNDNKNADKRFRLNKNMKRELNCSGRENTVLTHQNVNETNPNTTNHLTPTHQLHQVPHKKYVQ